MDLKKLTQLDVKDLAKIDYKKLGQELLKQPQHLVSALLICVTLFVSIKIITSKQAQTKSVRQEIYEMETKQESIDKYEATKKELENFLDKLPAGVENEQELINIITYIAEQNGIRISSISGATIKEKGNYTTISLTLRLTAESYKDAWLFIRAVEISKNALRLDAVTIQPGPQSRQGSGHRRDRIPEDDMDLDIVLNVTSTAFKNIQNGKK